MRQQAAHNNVAQVRRRFAILTLGWALGLLLAAPAAAAGLTPDADCQLHSRLTQDYTVAELREGLSKRPAYQREYSDCANILQQALLQKINHLKGGDSSGGGGSFLPTWLIVVLAVLVVGGVGLGVVALRNRGSGPPPG
jgi:hypothetical protein